MRLTQLEAAEIAGVTDVTIRKWMDDDPTLPFDRASRTFPAREFGIWLRTELVLKSGGRYLPDRKRLIELLGGEAAIPIRTPTLPGMPEPPRIETREEAERRLAVAKADKQELDNAERAGKLVQADVATHAWVDIVTRVKTKLLRIPSALAPLVYGKSDVFEIQGVLDDGVREALEELADDWRDATGDTGDDGKVG